MIDKETVQRIKDAADIVEVVGDYVNLTRRGANYMGLCPFHNERTPSFSVNQKKNFCYCFSCHKGGSPVNFIMEKEGVSYHDALLQLAKKYNIHVEEKELTDEERARITAREALLVASEWAMEWFHNNLFNTEEGRAIGLSYLYGRGITDEAIRKYKIGYSPDNGSAMVKAALSKGFDINILKELGLVGTGKEGRNFDKFRGRVIFPIRNSSGKTVAFGGRDLKGGPAKYINSPETLLYKKSNELYGIFEAKTDIVKQDKVLLMEGYLDVVGSWQSGVTNAVASSGTALTDGQIMLFHRFTERVTLVYDGDSAGIKAAFRGIDMLLSHKLQVKVLLLPDGDDPDSFARKHTPEQFRKYIEDNETDIIEFKAKVLMSEAGSGAQEQSRAIMSVVESIACIPNDVERSLYIQKCSIIMGADEKSVAAAVAARRRLIVRQLAKQRHTTQDKEQTPPSVTTANDPSTLPSTPSFFKSNVLNAIEKEILKYCIRYGYLDFCEAEDEDGNVVTMSVLDYIIDEMEADSLSFTNESYTKVIEELKSLIPDYEEAFNRFNEKLEKECQDKLEQGYGEIASKFTDLDSIRREESKLEEFIRTFREKETRVFVRDYPGLELSSHENDEIRGLVTELLHEPHQLSAIYYRDGQRVETEEDKLDEIVKRAISELRSEILNIRIKELYNKLSEASSLGDSESQITIMKRLQKLLSMRSRIAKNLGDRILSPR